ncbi:ABC transporter substrate binding protein [Paenibacillus sp. GCM10012307]|uniref:ABC transporter substrate-binding protein n=1 Tax=Paenibacillus roseus TaxID=2798579 RepID=A0A934MU41_9BACL|nr:ABC transporter substrate-binding protein [Paenibacillus roseus]MBJ6360702.1 ABC transporter substrate-binding protein [Paenibacillus roseus]
MKKRTWLMLMLSAMLVIAAGCGSKPNNESAQPSNGNTSGAAEGKVYKVAISQITEHPSLDATREGFLAALKDAGIAGDNLKLDYNNAQGDQTNNLSIAQKVADGNDLVFAIATPSAQAVVKHVTKTPVVFAAVTDPLDAKLVADLDAPGGNVTGASDTNPEAIKQLMKFIGENFKEVKKVGVVINEGESNAVVMTKIAETALQEYGISIVKAAVTNTSEVQQAAQSLVGRVDALFVTLDNTVINGVSTVIKVANDNRIPFFSSDRDTVEQGAFATVGFKYYDHGYQAGQMAADILKNGKNPGEMKVTFPDKLDLILNLKAAEAQGITVTDEMKAQVNDPETNIIQ